MGAEGLQERQSEAGRHGDEREQDERIVDVAFLVLPVQAVEIADLRQHLVEAVPKAVLSLGSYSAWGS